MRLRGWQRQNGRVEEVQEQEQLLLLRGGPAVAAPAVPSTPTPDAAPGWSERSGAGCFVLGCSCEGIEGVRYGKVIEGVAPPKVLDAKTVHPMADGRQLFCCCINDSRWQSSTIVLRCAMVGC